VGFRPFVAALALRHGLTGHVANDAAGVEVEVEGPSSAVDAFLDQLPTQVPPLAQIVSVRWNEIPPRGTIRMEILPSKADASPSALVPPDVAVCADCLRELGDPRDRRFRYPFTSCTSCGPRYTVIADLPHDRARTTMGRFTMCSACRAEYLDPTHRRFHAQANACPACGPAVALVTSEGHPLAPGDPLREGGRMLSAGKILAIKGIGGFHLAVNPEDDEAVRRLRSRKRREAKPLALMCRDLEEAARHVVLDEDTRTILASCARPIVLCPKRLPTRLSDAVAPENAQLGIMLPYTPLHVLLLAEGPATLVMTSGNLSDEPIAIDNAEARARLASVADAFLTHDRDILLGNDDSVVRIAGNRPRFVRRSRGYVPEPIPLGRELPSVLAVGAELKSTVCILRGDQAFVSQHVGDLDHAASIERFEATIAQFSRILGAKPLAIARDLHPDYASSRWAETQNLPVFAVQHHHAHVLACASEHGVFEPVLGIALDGAGLGTDGALWGGEILVADPCSFVRAGHLGYVRQPGGDRAAQEPYRMAISYLAHTFADRLDDYLPEPLRATDSVGAARISNLKRLVTSGVCSPWTSSCGRLFDGVASLCGLVQTNRFEAEAAMRLEACAEEAGPLPAYPIATVTSNDGVVVLNPSLMIRPIVSDLLKGTPPAHVARRFHRTLAVALADACVTVQAFHRSRLGARGIVVLAGGCFTNRILLEDVSEELSARGLTPLACERVPTNDGGLSLGQAVVAASRLASGTSARGQPNGPSDHRGVP
jgi:hydrogenase maturation protein HypF